MSKFSRRLVGTATASLLVAGGVFAGSAAPAQAESWDGTTVMSAQEVSEKMALMKGTVGACGALPGLWKTACKVAGNASIPAEFKNAAAQGCGLTLKWRATGSSMSYDKAEYAYALNC